MLDEYRGIFAIGDTMVHFSESETAVLTLLCLRYQKLTLEKKQKQENLVTAEEMQKAIKQVLSTDVSMSFTEATRSRVANRLKRLGIYMKKQPRAGYYLKDMHYTKKRR